MPVPATSETVNLHYFIIKVFDSHRTLIESKEWQNLYYHTLCNWRWYFDYRAALLKVKYPKYTVDTFWGHYPSHGPQKIDQLKNRIQSKKAKITEIKNKIKAVQDEWDEIFPLEDDLIYKQVISKLKRFESELSQMQNEFNELTGKEAE